MFKYEILKHNVEKGISGSDIKNIEFSRVDDLLKKVQMNNPFYPNSSFEKIHVYEKQWDGNYIKYEVSWEYYIE